MLGQLGIIIVGFADNIMVGHHSSIELAAASFVNNFFNLTFLFGLGFSYGLTPIIGGLFAEKQLQKAGEEKQPIYQWGHGPRVELDYAVTPL